MDLIDPDEFQLARPVLQALDHHLAVSCIFAKTVPAQIYVDQCAHPQSALAVASRRLFLAGEPGNQAFNLSLRRLFEETIFPQALAAGEEMFVLYYQPESWAKELQWILKDRYPFFDQRQYYVLGELKVNWRPLLPQDFSLRYADREILEDPTIKNPNFLTEEMCSERESVEDFLRRSFGLCLVHEDEIIGWCLSEYNFENACEVGIAVSPPYQRRGFATLLASAFIEEASLRGITEIGWHCYASNLPSVATALKVGYEKVADYPICLCWYHQADGLAVKGDACFRQHQYAEALDWLERAFLAGQSQGWVYWVAACSAAMLGKTQAAFLYLDQAVQKGVTNPEQIRLSPYLVSLRGDPAWQARFPGL